MKRYLIVLSLLGAAEAGAQTFQGGVRGAVRDQTAIIPGVVVTLTNEGTNQRRTSTSNDRGQYAFSNVAPGAYTLSAVVPGFRPFANTNIEVSVQRFAIVDIVLEVGAIEETVTVTSESPVLETATASNASSLEGMEMVTLPTPSRNPFFLSITTPNVVPSGNPQFQRMQDQNNSSALSIAGGPRRGNNYTLDGVPITDLQNRAVVIPSMESLEEVKVQVSTYDAEMGRTGGGVFNTFHRRGSNQLHGSALIQNRPTWGTGQLYFEKEAGEPKADGYYWLWGGSFGGAIIPDKTFFWASTEGYRTSVARNRVLTLPTAAMARGDFSESGRTIYDPLTTRPDPNKLGGFIRDPFPGNVIPPDRLNPVGLNIASFLTERGQGDISASANVVDAADQFSFNLTHDLSPNLTTSGTYMYYDSNEPFPMFIDNAYDENQGDLFRRVNLLAINTTYIPSDDSVMTFRYGFFQFDDDFSVPEFDVASLGFSNSLVSQVPSSFPDVSLDDYPNGGTGGGSAFRHYAHAVNGTWSKFVGNHTLKIGGDYRRIGIDLTIPDTPEFEFDPGFTQGPDPTNPASNTGDSLAGLLLGFPSNAEIEIQTPQQRFIDYFSAFVHDDWRVRDDLVLNLGVRFEHEQGLKEKSDILVVGFDRETPWPVQPIEDMTLRGGLMYAGQNGAPRSQGDPTPLKVGPRIGASWSLGPSTVVRGGYGVFWAPHQPAFTAARGFDARTFYLASSDGGLTPAGTLTDPFPSGLRQPIGSSEGLLTGAGDTVTFPDQFRKSGYVQQYSFDIQRDIGSNIVVSAGYLGSRSDRLGLAGTSAGRVNINQLDPDLQALGPELLEPVPNPFFGNPVFGNLSQDETIPRGQLLRPYPQFGDLEAAQVGEGRRRYHAFAARLQKRFRGGWSGRVNYTLSRTDDNIFGEGNFFSGRRTKALDNTDLDGEYSRSIVDTPHRLNVSGIVELPFGNGRRWLDGDGVLSAVFGGWTVSATGFYQSGFPVAVIQLPFNNGLFSAMQRPNVVAGVDPGHTGSTVDNLDTYLNPDAWTQTEAFTFGNAPRTDTRVRSPFQQNWDVAFQKTAAVGGARTSFRLEIINLFDTPAFGTADGRFGLRNFGRITNVGGFGRTFQFTFRIDW